MKYQIWYIVILLPLLSCTTTKPPEEFILIRPIGQKGNPSFTAEPSKSEAGLIKAANQIVPPKKTFQPNYHGSIGLGVGIFGVSTSYVKTFRPEDDQSAEKGRTEGRDIQIHAAHDHFGFDLSLHKFKGFYEQSGTSGNFTIHPDLEMERSAASLFFVSDPDSFQFNAAFGQTAYSEESGWSYILMFSLDQSGVNNLPATLTSDLTTQSSNPATSMEALTAGFLAGVGGRVITTDMGWFSGIFASIAAVAGPALQKSQISYADGTVEKKSQVQTIKTNARFALGIDKGTWFVGSSYWGDNSKVPGEKFDLELVSSQIESFVGMRF